jgi:UbiD family decarboxylase
MKHKTFDLRNVIESYENAGQLRRIHDSNIETEISALTELNAKRGGPAFLFDSIQGYDPGFRILSGSMLNQVTLGLTIGLKETSDNIKMLSEVSGLLKKAEEQSSDFPVEYVENGTVMENIQLGDDVDLSIFPVPKWHPDDGGAYIGTGCINIHRDPDTGWVNLGTYRSMVHDRNTVTTEILPNHHGNLIANKYWDIGKPCPVVLCIGVHPLLFLMGGTDIPAGINEYEWAGAIVGRSVPVVRGKVTGLPIPADAEIALEGYMERDDLVLEGPFGEFTGYYAGGRTLQHCIRVKAVYYRNEPIMLASPPGKPPHDFSYFTSILRSASLTNTLKRAGIPGVRSAWIHAVGGSRCFIVTSIHQMYGGHATQAAVIASNCPEGAMMSKYSIIVDDDIDPSDLNQVIWAMSMRSDPAVDIDIIRNSVGCVIDPMISDDDKMSNKVFNGLAIIRAVKPFHRIQNGTFSKIAEWSPEILQAIKEKYKDLF